LKTFLAKAAFFQYNGYMKRVHRQQTTKKKSKLYTFLYFFPIALSLFGLFFVFEASAVRSFQEYGNSFHYVLFQAIWILLGIVVMTVASFFDYKKLYLLSFPFMLVTIILLFLVLVIGTKVGGARRWIDLGPFSLQPTEFAKLATIMYLSSWFVHKEKKRFFSFLFFIGILMFLILLQPDMGTSMIIYGLGTIIYFLAGIELHYLYLFIPASVGAALALIKISPYRFNRLTAFLDPSKDPRGIGYHINQIIISLSNGGLFGEGFGHSRQKYLFLPEAHTDSIFAIIGEEVGFIGSIILIAVFFFLIYLLYRVAVSCPNRFGYLLAGGILGFFSLQIIINLGSMVGMMPLTGVPLPFISYGGSHILTSFALMGIIINIAKRSHEL
jgi:cell division protein FtsW